MKRQGMVVCHECVLLLRQSARAGSPRSTARLALARTTRRTFYPAASSQESRTRNAFSKQIPNEQPIASFSAAAARQAARSKKTPQLSSGDLNALRNGILDLSSSALRPTDRTIPLEGNVLHTLRQLQTIAKSLLGKAEIGEVGSKKEKQTTATSALLGSVNVRQDPESLSASGLLKLISEKSEEILRHHNVFITPAILKTYVDIQTMLRQLLSLPDIFELYADKATPRANGNNVVYKPVSPDAAKAAVEKETADMALTAALEAHDLTLCLDIITTTYSAKAYQKAKALRQALLPGTLLASTPVLAYALSTQFAALQWAVEPEYAKVAAFTGIMTYVTTLSILGYITIATTNDQMVRVSWAKGIGLWERWVREDERAALDRVAQRWGFEEPERRGEEEGEEWEVLREFIGMRGMFLDLTELMNGMQ